MEWVWNTQPKQLSRRGRIPACGAKAGAHIGHERPPTMVSLTQLPRTWRPPRRQMLPELPKG